LVLRGASGTLAAPTATTSGNGIGQVSGNSWDGATWVTSSGISMGATENATNTNRGSDLSFFTTPNGTNTFSTRMYISNAGNVGIGTTTPRTSLEVNGVISGPPVTADDGDAFINFATSNTRFTTANCQAFRLDNLKDGAHYTFVVKGTTSTTCSFTGWTGVGTGTSLTVHLPPDHAATTVSTHTVYSFFVAGSDVYMSWVSGL
jgi:hypothetical protein